MIRQKKNLINLIRLQISITLLLGLVLTSFFLVLFPALKVWAGFETEAARINRQEAPGVSLQTAWRGNFERRDGAIPEGVQYFGKGGNLHELTVQQGALTGRIGSKFILNPAVLQWSPEDLVFHKDDLVTLTFIGDEQENPSRVGWSHRIRILPAGVPIDQTQMTDLGIELTTQAAPGSLWARGYSPQLMSILSANMYTPSSGRHAYRMEINHNEGVRQLGSFRFYRDGILVAESESIWRNLASLNQVRFLLSGGDPNGAVYTWSEIQIEIRPNLDDDRAL